MEHMLVVCERHQIVGAVNQRINLTLGEREDLLALAVEGSITCNCERRKKGLANRSGIKLERMVTDAVLQARGLRARENLGVALGLKVGDRVKVRDGVLEREGAQIIRIDFEKRMRVIE